MSDLLDGRERVLIVGLPSGEAMTITSHELFVLYENDLIANFNPKKKFWEFKDKNLNRIKLFIKNNKDI